MFSYSKSYSSKRKESGVFYTVGFYCIISSWETRYDQRLLKITSCKHQESFTFRQTRHDVLQAMVNSLVFILVNTCSIIEVKIKDTDINTYPLTIAHILVSDTVESTKVAGQTSEFQYQAFFQAYHFSPSAGIIYNILIINV